MFRVSKDQRRSASTGSQVGVETSTKSSPEHQQASPWPLQAGRSPSPKLAPSSPGTAWDRQAPIGGV